MEVVVVSLVGVVAVVDSASAVVACSLRQRSRKKTDRSNYKSGSLDVQGLILLISDSRKYGVLLKSGACFSSH